MIEKTKRRKKGFITEHDISSLLQRYTATTVLALLQEVAQCQGAKIDWNSLVKKTSTGISNVREYQMLWRHLAYRHGLIDKLDDGAEPLDDDSDLEYELEAFPEISNEASTEAAACVKVLIDSGLPSELGHPNNSTVEAPLTINIPHAPLSSATAEYGTTRSINITVPVSVQKQPQPLVTTSEGLDASGAPGVTNARKRKKWSADEDKKLSDAVALYGEGNWTSVLKTEEIWDRTPQQLSQRWTFLKKKRLQAVASSSGGSQLNEERQAARHAMNLALDLPVRNVAANNSAGATLNGSSIGSLPPSASTESLPTQYPSQQRPTLMKSSSLGPLDSAGKPQVNLKGTSLRPNFASDPVRAAAVAAGARIATQSDAATLLKAAQAKNAVHIMPVGGSSVKTSLPGGKHSHLDSAPNVHFISTGQGTAAPSAGTTVSVGGSSHGLAKPHALSTQYAAAPSAALSTQKCSEHAPKEDAKVGRAVEVSRTENEPKRQVQNGECSTLNGSGKQVQEGNADSRNREAEQKSSIAENSNALPKVASTSRKAGEAEQKCSIAVNSNALPKVASTSREAGGAVQKSSIAENSNALPKVASTSREAGEAAQKSSIAENSNALPKVASSSREAEQKSSIAENSNAIPKVASHSREAEQKSSIAENSNALPKEASTSREAEQKSVVAAISDASPKVSAAVGDRVDGDDKNSKDSMLTGMVDKKIEQPPVQIKENQSLTEPQSVKKTVADECGVPGKKHSDPIQPCKIVST